MQEARVSRSCKRSNVKPPLSVRPRPRQRRCPALPCPPARLPLQASKQDQIEKVRRPEDQMGRMGVPEAHVDSGHAFHTYTLTSPDGSGERASGSDWARASLPWALLLRGPVAAASYSHAPCLHSFRACPRMLAGAESSAESHHCRRRCCCCCFSDLPAPPLPPPPAVTLEFKHNVCGREVYAEGTVDAAIFLHRQVAAAAPQKLYNMIDVLSAGAMR